MPIVFNKKIILGFFLVALCGLFYLMHSLCNKDKQWELYLASTKERILQLREKINRLDGQQLPITGGNEDTLLYLITPTYTRYTQQADLIRLSYTLKHVPYLHWIIVEDSDIKTKLVLKVLKDSGIPFSHLNVKTRQDLTRGKNDPRWKKHRGVDQRNLALKWLRKNADRDKSAVVYFADDDNTYHIDLFKEMRTTHVLSMWPVALVGGLRWEGPICKNGKVLKFFTGWMPSRMFPVDMASFAFNINLVFQHENVYINPDVKRGYLESDFLEQLKIKVEDVEAKAEDCTKILVWHTQTSEPNMKQELRLQQQGKGSNPDIII